MNFPIQQRFINEYLALVAVGATHEEAIQQVAQSNEVEVDAVIE